MFEVLPLTNLNIIYCIYYSSPGMPMDSPSTLTVSLALCLAGAVCTKKNIKKPIGAYISCSNAQKFFIFHVNVTKQIKYNNVSTL